jgi:SWI/SNF-related matrix-associated actin-dependent regulator 1 of chromatin subfamily A
MKQVYWNREDKQFKIMFGGNDFKEAYEFVKAMPNREYVPDLRHWICPSSNANYDLLFGAGFEMCFNISEWTQSIDVKVKKIHAIDYSLFKGFREYQIEGVQFIENNQGFGVIGDVCGLGKTIQALGFLKLHPELRPAVIVCPAFLKINWKREIEKWLGKNENVLILKGRSSYKSFDAEYLMEKPSIYIINYDILGMREGKKIKGWSATLKEIGIKAIIVDESQYASNNKTIRAKALVSLTKSVKKCRIFLSGTPIKSKPAEFFTVLNLVDPVNFPNRWQYLNRYCSPSNNGWGMTYNGLSNWEELRNLLQSVMIRRKKEDVLKELPEKNTIIQDLEVDEIELDKYRKATESFKEWLKTHIINGNTKLQAKEQIEILKQLAYIAKRNSVVKWIENFLESGEKLVVVAYHTKAINDLVEHFKCDKIDGSVSMEKRQEIVDRFQNDKSVKLLVGQINAMGVGITLTAASNMAIVEFGWTPADHDQVSDRCIIENTLVFCLKTVHNGKMSVKKIQEITVGDCVLSHTGNYRKVINVHEKGHRGLITTIKYKGWDKPLVCTYDHKILIKRNEKIIWLEAHRLLPTDSMVFPKIKNCTFLECVVFKDEWRVHKTVKKIAHCVHKDCTHTVVARGLCNMHYRRVCRAKGELPKKEKRIPHSYIRLPDSIVIDNDWLYLMGWYVAEGFSSTYLNKGRFISFSAHEKEEIILLKIAKTLQRINVRSFIYRKKKTKAIEMRSYSTELALWFKDWFGHLAKNKKLPEEILNLPKEQAIVFLQGYTDGDGYYRRNSVEWVTVSPVLCYQMCLLAVRSGYIPTMREVNNESNKDQWVGGYTKNGTGNKRLSEQDDNYIFRPISIVETKYSKIKVYDLTVENDHSFTIGFSTVHNCHRYGQLNSVSIYYLVAFGTIEETIIHMLQYKSGNVNKVLDGDEKTKHFDVDILHDLIAEYKKGR